MVYSENDINEEIVNLDVSSEQVSNIVSISNSKPIESEFVQGILYGIGDVCLSGGADGADSQWGMMAGRLGHKVIHFTFDDHKTSVPEVEQVVLTEEILTMADPYLVEANKILQRRWPSNSAGTNNLLRRNYFQIAWTGSVYAVGSINNGKVSGGTAWAVAMYQNRFISGSTPKDECQLYFYDQDLHIWWQWNENGWFMREIQPPQPSKVWTGIGTRELNTYGKWEIRQLMGGYPVTDSIVKNLIAIESKPTIGGKMYVGPGNTTVGYMDFSWSGGWCTISSLREGIDSEGNCETWVNIQELNCMEIPWSKYASEQENLQKTYGMTRSFMKFA